jgi:hypothetical protein
MICGFVEYPRKVEYSSVWQSREISKDVQCGAGVKMQNHASKKFIGPKKRKCDQMCTKNKLAKKGQTPVGAWTIMHNYTISYNK